MIHITEISNNEITHNINQNLPKKIPNHISPTTWRRLLEEVP